MCRNPCRKLRAGKISNRRRRRRILGQAKVATRIRKPSTRSMRGRGCSDCRPESLANPCGAKVVEVSLCHDAEIGRRCWCNMKGETRCWNQPRHATQRRRRERSSKRSRGRGRGNEDTEVRRGEKRRIRRGFLLSC